MRMSFLPAKSILNWFRMMLETLRQRPALGIGMPSPLADLEAANVRYEAAKRKQEGLKKALKLATDEAQQGLFELKGKLAANRAVAAMIHGPYSPEFVLFGGKPRKSRRNPAAAEATTSTETQPAPNPPINSEAA